jgi:hypothetical protein
LRQFFATLIATVSFLLLTPEVAKANVEECREMVRFAQRVGLTNQSLNDAKTCRTGYPLMVIFHNGALLIRSDWLAYVPFAGASFRCYDYTTRQTYMGTFSSCRR